MAGIIPDVVQIYIKEYLNIKPVPIKGFTSTRLPVKLVFSEQFDDIQYAIQAERQIKGWSRKKKMALIKGDFKLLSELAACKNKSHYSNKQ